MRNFDLDNGNDSIERKVNPAIDMLIHMSEEQKGLMQYVMQAKLYLITNLDQIKSSYADYIFEQLCAENELLAKDKSRTHPETQRLGSRHAADMIKKYIVSCDSWLVLCNPEDGQPSVVADAYAFTSYDIEAYQEQLAVEYMVVNGGSRDFYTGLATNLAQRGAKYGGSYGVDWAANQLTQRGGRLGALSAHNAPGYLSTRRIERSFRGRVAQRNAKMHIQLKAERLAHPAKAFNFSGKKLADCAASLRKSSFKIVGKWGGPLTNIFDANAPTIKDGQKNWMQQIIPGILADYCKKHNNYHQLIKQQFLK